MSKMFEGNTIADKVAKDYIDDHPDIDTRAVYEAAYEAFNRYKPERDRLSCDRFVAIQMRSLLYKQGKLRRVKETVDSTDTLETGISEVQSISAETVENSTVSEEVVAEEHKNEDVIKNEGIDLVTMPEQHKETDKGKYKGNKQFKGKKHISAAERDALIADYLSGLTYKEISEKYAMPISTVRSDFNNWRTKGLIDCIQKREKQGKQTVATVKSSVNEPKVVAKMRFTEAISDIPTFLAQQLQGCELLSVFADNQDCSLECKLKRQSDNATVSLKFTVEKQPFIK